MKKKILLFLLILSALFCFLMITVNAETPELYIEFQVELTGSNTPVTVYVENPEAGNPRVNLTFDFYSDVGFTEKVDKSQITMLDFSNAVHSNPQKDYVDRFTTADPSKFPLCEEVRWFTRKFTSAPSSIFNNWTQLKRFDFGCLTVIDYNFLSNSGIEEVVLPDTVYNMNNSVFAGCTSLKSVTIMGGLTSVGSGIFQNCTALETVNLGASTKTGESMFKGCTALTTVDLSANTMTSIGKFTFSGCTALETIISSGVNQEGAVILPEGVTWIGQEAFYNCDSIKYLSLPSTVTYLGPSIIRDSSGLEFVDFNENKNNINLDNWGHFNGCSGLKAASLPDGIKIINNRFMTYCSNMQAVYLPANLEQMNTNGNGQGPFCFSGKMYFVQEPFEVRDESGYFLGDSFVMPEKPDMYFMPENLSKAGGNVNSGTWFRDCAGLNNIIVMPEAFTESTVVQMFRGIASSSQRKTIVYLGKMTNYSWSEMNKYIDFVFAHPDNTDIGTLNFTSWYNRNNENCYFYFCSTGNKYTMAKATAEEVAATLETNSYHHVKELSKSTEATCTNPKMVADYCFCGAIMGEPQTEGDALGHSLGAKYDIFTQMTVKGYACRDCARCEYVEKTEHDAAILVELGYSVKTFETDGGVSFENGYTVNKELLAKYEAAKGVTVSFGLAFNSNEGFNFDGTLNSFKLQSKLSTTNGNESFGAFVYKINYADTTHLDSEIIIGIYACETAEENESITFVNAVDGVFTPVTYNSLLK